MSKKPQRPIIPPPPRSVPRPEVPISAIALVCQLAQDGLAALLAKGVPMTRLEAHSAALAMLQRHLGLGRMPSAIADQPKSEKPSGG